jgi:hypothetical protein
MLKIACKDLGFITLTSTPFLKIISIPELNALSAITQSYYSILQKIRKEILTFKKSSSVSDRG